MSVPGSLRFTLSSIERIPHRDASRFCFDNVPKLVKFVIKEWLPRFLEFRAELAQVVGAEEQHIAYPYTSLWTGVAPIHKIYDTAAPFFAQILAEMVAFSYVMVAIKGLPVSIDQYWAKVGNYSGTGTLELPFILTLAGKIDLTVDNGYLCFFPEGRADPGAIIASLTGKSFSDMIFDIGRAMRHNSLVERYKALCRSELCLGVTPSTLKQFQDRVADYVARLDAA